MRAGVQGYQRNPGRNEGIGLQDNCHGLCND
jgi:hypothetical protein